jgi:hypothetical protein
MTQWQQGIVRCSGDDSVDRIRRHRAGTRIVVDVKMITTRPTTTREALLIRK